MSHCLKSTIHPQNIYLSRRARTQQRLLREVVSKKYKERLDKIKSNKTTERAESAYHYGHSSYRSQKSRSEKESVVDGNKQELEISQDKIDRDSQNALIIRLKEALTKPVREITGNISSDISTYHKRLDDLKKKFANTMTEKMNSLEFTRIQNI